MNISAQAFIWGLPTVDLYRILHNFALDPHSPEFKVPISELAHSRRLADASDTSIVAMNVDTPYSYAWLDLRPGPVELDMPSHEPDRYMSAMVVDLYTYIVGYISPRTSGDAGETVLIAGPGWQGTSDLRVLRCPTELCLVLCRTQLFDAADLPNVAALQDRISVTPLEAEPLPAPIPPVDVRQPPGPEFFDVLHWMLPLMPPLDGEQNLRARLAAADNVEGLREGYFDVLERIKGVRSSAELFGSRERFAGDDLEGGGGLPGHLGQLR